MRDGLSMIICWDSCLCWRSPCQQLHNGNNIAKCASEVLEGILRSCNVPSFALIALLIFYLQNLLAPFCCSVWSFILLHFSPCTASPELLHYREEFIRVIFQYRYELIFVLYSALFYNSFSR